MVATVTEKAEVIVKPVENDDELRRAVDLITAVHSDADVAHARWLESSAVNYPNFRLEHTRIALCGPELVGALRLSTDTIRIGEARLKMGGIGWVAISPDHRNRGICQRLLDDVLHYMREHSYHVSMLFGIPNFYHRFGYTTSLADHTIRVDTMEARTFENPFRVTPAKPSDAAAIQKMHGAGDGQTACAVIRTTAHLKNKWRIRNNWYMLKDEEGRPVAYLNGTNRADAFDVIEIGIEEPGLCSAVVGAAGALAEDRGLATVRFQVPPSHTFARYWLQFPSVHETRIYRDAEGMMRFINTEETLESMVPEWESRLAESGARDLSGEFTLVVDGQPYRVRARRGAIDVAAELGPAKINVTTADLMHLVTGYVYPEDTLNGLRHGVPAEAQTLFATIFLKRTPYVWTFDRF